MAQWGQYYRKWTAMLPILILGMPAFACIGRRSRQRHAAGAASPAAHARRMRRAALTTLIIGLIGAGVSGGAFWLSQGLPDGNERAEPFDIARLGSGPVPQTRVRIEGRLDPEASAGLARGGVEDSVTYYAAFRADADGKDAPVRLFVERGTRPETLNTLQGFIPGRPAI